MSSSVLRDRLAELVGAGLLETDEHGRYRASRQGGALLEALEPLSRWAERWGAENRA
jgi:DNA-binding HxlR family transcriptional regulator